MSSVYKGTHLDISLFGESHSAAVGVVVDGFPAGYAVDWDDLLAFTARRAPGKDRTSTQRQENDHPRILSGIVEDTTCGSPICATIENSDIRSGDYTEMRVKARPGHADYTGFLRYGGYADIRGGGHFSARLTAGLVFAGGLCRQWLARQGVVIGARLLSVGAEIDGSPDLSLVTPKELQKLSGLAFPVRDPEAARRMRAAIETARLEGDSLGGVVECAVAGFPGGLGNPIFGGLESVLASLVFSIPAVKGVEFGAGFQCSRMRGSRNNDPFIIASDGSVRTTTNNHGGILGGISSGMPITLRAAFKPTPSIGITQETIDFVHNIPAAIQVKGRHDPCVAVRAVPCVEAAVAIALCDLLLGK